MNMTQQYNNPKHTDHKVETHFRLIIGIDFGTDGTAMAYSVPPSDDVYVRQNWHDENESAKRQKIGVKMKTNILLNEKTRQKTRQKSNSKYMDDQNIFREGCDDTKEGETTTRGSNNENDYEFVEFGEQATIQYVNRDTYHNSEGWLYFESFKMALFKGKTSEMEKVKINEYLTAANGIKVKSEIVFIHALKYIVKQAKMFIKKENINIKNMDHIQWVISVPAIWSNESKSLMLKWLKLAGIGNKNIKNQVILQYEPDCASISVQHDLKLQSKGLKKGEHYLLVDLGGGTADFAVHELSDDNYVSECYHPSGGAWGGNYVDIQYEKLINDVFGEENIKKFKSKDQSKYIELINNFSNHSKRTFFNRNFKDFKLKKTPRNTHTHNILLPMEFIDFLENDMGLEDLETYLEDFDDIDLKNEYLELTYDIWYKLFNTCVKPICDHILFLLKKDPKIQHIILVGGFSKSHYLQYKVWQSVSTKHIQITVPERPLLSVIDGAVRLGLNPNFVRMRMLSKSYGILVSKPLKKVLKMTPPIDKKFIKENTIEYDDPNHKFRGRKYVQGIYQPLIKKNEPIPKNHEVSFSCTAFDSGNKQTTDPIFSCDYNHYVDYKKATLIGTIVGPIQKNNKAKLEITLRAGDTTLQVEIKNKDTGEKSMGYIKYKL